MSPINDVPCRSHICNQGDRFLFEHVQLSDADLSFLGSTIPCSKSLTTALLPCLFDAHEKLAVPISTQECSANQSLQKTAGFTWLAGPLRLPWLGSPHHSYERRVVFFWHWFLFFFGPGSWWLRGFCGFYGPGSWWLLVAPGGSWWLLVAPGGSWWLLWLPWLLVASGGFCGFYGFYGSWLLWLIYHLSINLSVKQVHQVHVVH